MSGVALRSASDAAADPDALGVRVPVTVHETVLSRVLEGEGFDLPPEELRVVALGLLGVLPEDLEVNDRLSHGLSYPRPCCRELQASHLAGSPKSGKSASVARKNVNSTIRPLSISRTCSAHGS